MFKVEVGDKQYSVHFSYLKDSKVRPVTVCSILDAEENLVDLETAVCSKQDRFVRSEGRKLAFTRAVASFPREDRKAFWDKYFQVCKK